MAAALPSSHAAIVISEIDLANDRVELVNTGGGAVDLTSWWWCNRVNGSPFYSQVTSASTIDAGLSSPGASLSNFQAGDYLVLGLTGGFLPDANGELGLYNTNSFGGAGAIEDYLLWGANGIRDNVAQTAGIWTDNDSIDISGLGLGETIQLTPGLPGNAASEYQFGASTFGASNIPEPSAAVLALGGVALMLRRRR